MIDLKQFRQNPEKFIKAAKLKGEEIDFDLFAKLDKELRELQTRLDTLNAQRNQISKQIPQIKDSAEKQKLIQQMQQLKKEIEQLQDQYSKIKAQHRNIWIQIPNPPAEDVPEWEDDSQNVVVKEVLLYQDSPESQFLTKQYQTAFQTAWVEPASNSVPHRQILEKRNLIDPKRWAKVSGSRFVYLRDWLVLLELALVNFAVEKLLKKWFSPTIVPNLVKEEAMIATWFFPADRKQIYQVNPDQDNLFLIWTSEVPLVAQHSNEILEANQLPLRYIGISPCYRREVGKSWKDIRWLIRLHQFEKVEMVSFVLPQDSEKEHEFLTEIEEEIYQELGLPYRKMLICTWDLGAPAAKKYDLEWWFAWMQTFKEITSCSNTTDYQARRANIKFKSWKEKKFVHTLNWTAIAVQRTLALIVENYQTNDGRIVVPVALRKYILGNLSII